MALFRLAIPVAASLLFGAMLLFSGRRLVTTVEVAGTSMAPLLLPGDYLVVRRRRRDGARAGDVIAFRGERDLLLLKRVVGIPGESLRVGDEVYVNGRRLDEPYAHGRCPPDQFRGVQQLAPDEYFALGDARDASTDSRDFGPVHRDRIEGVAWLRYWPPTRIGYVGHIGAGRRSFVLQ